MPISAHLPVAQPVMIACRPSQLRLSLSGRDGDFNGMSHSGVELIARNIGRDCSLPALPRVIFRDARGEDLAALRRAPAGMHPGPVLVPVNLAAGHSASTELRWVSSPVFARNRSLRPATINLQLGGQILSAPVTAVLYGESGKAVAFDQTPLKALEGMPAG